MLFETYGIIEPIYGKHKYYEEFYERYSMHIKYNIIISDLLHSEKSNLPNYGIYIKNKIENEMDDINKTLRIAGLRINTASNNMTKSLADNDYLIKNKHFENDYEKYINNITDFQQLIILYGMFESVVKSYIRDKKIEGTIFQRQMINILFDNCIDSQLFQSTFNKSQLIELTIDDIKCLWNYFTTVRNLFAHSGGVVDSEFIKNCKNEKSRLLEIEKNIFSQLHYIFDDEAKIFIVENIAENSIYSLTEFAMRLFRNLIVAIWESIYIIERDNDSVNEDDNNDDILSSTTKNLKFSLCNRIQNNILQTKDGLLPINNSNFYISGYICPNCIGEDSFLYKSLFNKEVNLNEEFNVDIENVVADKIFTCPLCKSIFFPCMDKALSDGDGVYITNLTERKYSRILNKINNYGSCYKLY